MKKKYPPFDKYSHKEVRLRSEQQCFHSSVRKFSAGEFMLAVKVYPSSEAGSIYGIKKPTTFYFCGICSNCVTGWEYRQETNGKNKDSDNGK